MQYLYRMRHHLLLGFLYRQDKTRICLFPCYYVFLQISPILRKYLLQFRVEPVEYIWWRKQRGDSIEWLTQPREVLDKADEFLSTCQFVFSCAFVA